MEPERGSQAGVNRDSESGQVWRDSTGPDCAGTPGHLKNAGLYLDSSEETVRGLSRYNTELCLESATLATASKPEHRDVRGS